MIKFFVIITLGLCLLKRIGRGFNRILVGEVVSVIGN